jgi:hypothetical protein
LLSPGLTADSIRRAFSRNHLLFNKRVYLALFAVRSPSADSSE